MRSELVVSRFCEDLSWVKPFEAVVDHITIYDKSPGGGRDRIHLGGWSSSDGPDRAELWPGAIPVENVGCESHTHMHHTVERWGDLADFTVFLSGDAPGHYPGVLQTTADMLSRGRQYFPFCADRFECDQNGLPHINNRPFPELREGWNLFYPGEPMPDRFKFHGFGMYLVSKERLERWDVQTWMQARDWCQRKIHSMAMERLYDTLFGVARTVRV